MYKIFLSGKNELTCRFHITEISPREFVNIFFKKIPGDGGFSAKYEGETLPI
jgi:hypothetical protein